MFVVERVLHILTPVVVVIVRKVAFRTYLVRPSVHFGGLIPGLWANRDGGFCMSFLLFDSPYPKVWVIGSPVVRQNEPPHFHAIISVSRSASI